MKLWDEIKNYFYNNSLSKRVQQIKEERVITSLYDAKSIGIIYDSSNPGNDIIVTKFAQNLRDSGKHIDVLGFVNDKTTEQKAGVLVFNKNNLDWSMVPKNEAVENFAKQNFDLLLAAFTTAHLPLEYVTAISMAKWKVGTYAADKTALYDMMISLGGRIELSYFLEQATHFLNQIKYDKK